MNLLRWSPRKYRYKQLHRTPSAGSQDDGTLYHSFTVGGAKSEVMPFKNLRSDAAKKWWANCQKRGSIPMRSKDKVYDIQQAATASRAAIMAEYGRTPCEGHREKTIRWTSPEGANCTGTTDLVFVFGKQGYIIELKSWDDVSTFKRSITMKGWDVQRAAYLQAWSIERPEIEWDHAFLAQELKPPYENGWFGPEEMTHDLGASKWRRACEIYAHHTKNDSWDTGYERQTYEASPWEFSQWSDEI